jgi:hypothetical protein
LDLRRTARPHFPSVALVARHLSKNEIEPMTDTITKLPTKIAYDAAHDILDALHDMRMRCAVLSREIQDGRLLSADTVEALQGIDRQSDRIALAVIDTREAQKEAAAVIYTRD